MLLDIQKVRLRESCACGACVRVDGWVERGVRGLRCPSSRQFAFSGSETNIAKQRRACTLGVYRLYEVCMSSSTFMAPLNIDKDLVPLTLPSMIYTAIGRVDLDLAETQAKLSMFLPPHDATTHNFAICIPGRRDL